MHHPQQVVGMVASSTAGNISKNRRKNKQHFTQHAGPVAESTCSQQRLQTSVRLNTDLHHYRGAGTTVAIIHVEVEITTSPASEADLSTAGNLRRTFPLHTAQQGSECLLPKGRNAAVIQHECSLHTETGKDLPLQDRAIATSSTVIWGSYGQHQGSPS